MSVLKKIIHMKAKQNVLQILVNTLKKLVLFNLLFWCRQDVAEDEESEICNSFVLQTVSKAIELENDIFWIWHKWIEHNFTKGRSLLKEFYLNTSASICFNERKMLEKTDHQTYPVLNPTNDNWSGKICYWCKGVMNTMGVINTF